MAEPRRTIQVHDDTFNQLYAIKGPRRSMEDAIKDLLNTVFPEDKDEPSQERLAVSDLCPLCEGELREDENGIFCPACGYEDDGGERE
jgi:hypothetical protein